MTGPTDEADRDTPETEPALDPADAFSLLGNATRLEIVTALHSAAVPTPAAFGELYDAVDVDDTGQFNYHLDQLVPHFVRKDDDAYELTTAGGRIGRAVSAGRYTDRPQLDPFPVDGACYDCGAAALWGSYEDERFDVACRDCGVTLLAVEVPPSLVRDRDPEAFVAAFERWATTRAEQAARGICPECGGAVDASIQERDFESLEVELVAYFRCTVCGDAVTNSIGGVAALDPAVAAFHRRRGGDPLRNGPYWASDELVSNEYVEVLSRDPWRVRTSFYADGDACHVELDGDLEVRELTIVPGGASAE